MDKIRFLLIFALLGSFIGNAQLTKRNWLVGGNGNLYSYKTRYMSNGGEVSSTSLGFQFSPDIGYFLADKLSIGSNAILGFNNPSDNDNNSFAYGIGPFVRYYLLKADKRINILTQAQFTFIETKTGGFRSHSNEFGFKAGPAIFLNNIVALEITLEYVSSKQHPASSEPVSTQNFQIGIGFQIHLQK